MTAEEYKIWFDEVERLLRLLIYQNEKARWAEKERTKN
jgi:hypothetical protein